MVGKEGKAWTVSIARSIDRERTIVDPVTEGDTSGDQHTLDHHQLATVVCFGRFRLPGRDGTGVHAIANSSDDTTDNPVRQRVRGALQDCTGGHSTTAQKDSPPTAKRVTDEDRQAGTEETAQVVRCDSNALVRASLRAAGTGLVGVGAVVRVDIREILDERGQLEKTASDALVVTKQPAQLVHSLDTVNIQEIQTTQRTDSQVEGSALPAVELWDPKHGEVVQ